MTAWPTCAARPRGTDVAPDQHASDADAALDGIAVRLTAMAQSLQGYDLSTAQGLQQAAASIRSTADALREADIQLAALQGYYTREGVSLLGIQRLRKRIDTLLGRIPQPPATDTGD